MDTTITVNIRPTSGKGVARKLRKAGRIPGVVYGPGNDPVSVSFEPRALLDLFRHTQNRNTIVDLDIDGTKQPTLVREVQRHPETREVLHVDFLRVSSDHKIEVMVPVVPFGKPAGALLGGRLRLIRRSIRTRCQYDKIPKAFEIDVSPLNIGDMISASDVATPDGVEMVYDHDFHVLTLYGKKGDTDTDTDTEAEAEAEATPEAES